jgi:hypothetical protein
MSVQIIFNINYEAFFLYQNQKPVDKSQNLFDDIRNDARDTFHK